MYLYVRVVHVQLYMYRVFYLYSPVCIEKKKIFFHVYNTVPHTCVAYTLVCPTGLGEHMYVHILVVLDLPPPLSLSLTPRDKTHSSTPPLCHSPSPPEHTSIFLLVRCAQV